MLAGAALRRVPSTTTDEARSDLAAHLELIGLAGEAADRNAAAIAFLTAVAELVGHPRQARHLMESAILAQCALQFSEDAPRDATTLVQSTAAGAAARAIRAGELEITETTVRAFFEHLAWSAAREEFAATPGATVV